MNVKLLGAKVITSLHIGAGRGLGHIDLPVIREKTTNYPYLPGSALKGVLRDKNEKEGYEYLSLAFGSRRDGEDETTAGSAFFTDARLLTLPIRSFYGTYANVSCPTIIKRLFADIRTFNETIQTPELPNLSGAQIAVVTPKSSSLVYEKKKVCLEDVDFDVVETDVEDIGLSLAQKFPNFGEAIADNAEARIKRFALVSDDAFAFLSETGTEVSARIRIDPETGIVQQGALWNQETLPSETFLYSFVFCDRIFGNQAQNLTPEKMLESLCPTGKDIYLQFGGKASTGLGRCHCRFAEV